jgi:hypothetical protein
VTDLEASLPAPSLHSRAARRATSPGIDTDKSLKSAKPPSEPLTTRPSVLGQQGGGITKKTKHGRKAVLSSKARKRKDKAMDKAEAVLDRTVNKIQRRKGQSKVIKSRSQAWDEINKRLGDSRTAARDQMTVTGGNDEDEGAAATDDDEVAIPDGPSTQETQLKSQEAAQRTSREGSQNDIL